MIEAGRRGGGTGRMTCYDSRMTPVGQRGGPAQVRPARREDLPACAAIVNAYIEATPWLPRTCPAEEIEAMFCDALLASRRVLVADDGAVAGYASYDPEGAFLAALYLAPHARGRGIGRAMLDSVKAAAPKGFKLNVWQHNPAARRFYEREGLRLEGGAIDDDGLPVWIMSWAGAAA